MKNLGLGFVAALSLACSAELGAISNDDPTGMTGSSEQATVDSAAVPIPQADPLAVAPSANEVPAPVAMPTEIVPVEEPPPEGISFGNDKWLDPEGYETATVKGVFHGYQVAFSRPFTSLDDLAGMEVTVTVSLGSLDTGSPGRDTNILEAYFEAAAFPSATAKFSGFEAGAIPTQPLVPGDVPGLAREFITTMDLEMRGTVQHHQNVRLQVTPEGAGYRVRTVAPIQVRVDMGMPVVALLARCQHFGISSFAPTDVNLFISP